MADIDCWCCTKIRPARLVASCFASLHVLVLCTASFSQTPLVIDELKANRAIAQADADRAAARHELAMWKLAQLQELRRSGHASWQEVAQQEVSAKSAKASALAAEQYLQVVIDWQTQLKELKTDPSFSESECIRLYMPGSPRLVAWIATDVASGELSERHLENLRAEQESLLDIDLSSFEAAIKKAERAADIHGRTGQDAAPLRGAEIRLRLARADYESAKARKTSANIVARRIALADRSREKSPSASPDSLGLVGTRFVDATSDGELARLVAAMATEETLANDQAAWLERQRDEVLTRIDLLEQLSEYSPTVLDELDQAKKQHLQFELQIDRARIQRNVHQQIANQYEHTIDPRASDVPAETIAVVDAHLVDATAVRHSLQLRQLKLQTASGRAAIEAEHDYRVERLKRVERIPERARPPRELEHLRQQIGGLERQLATVDRDLVLLGMEQQRLRHQLESQHGQQHQLVQASGGKLVRREQHEAGRELAQDPKWIAAALVAAVGFVGDAGEEPKWTFRNPTVFPYFESTTILDCMSRLRIHPTAASVPPLRCDDCDFPQRRSMDWKTTPRGASGLRLATDGIVYPSDLFCYVPYGSRLARCDDWCMPRASLRTPISCGFRTFNPYAKYPFGYCGTSIFSYRVGAPTRSSFPYRSNYLYRTAFPLRSNLYSSPYTRPATYRGFGYPWWRDESCFD